MEPEENRSGRAFLSGDEVLELLNRMERRVARLEAHLGVPPLPEADRSREAPPAAEQDGDADWLEYRIGERYLAQAGVVALIMGVGFLVTYLYTFLPPGASALIAFTLAGGTFLLGGLAGKNFLHLRLPLLMGGLLLLYYAALRLTRFKPGALVEGEAGVLVLGAAVALQAVASLRMKSQLLAAVALLSGYATGLVADGVHLTLSALVATSALAATFRLRNNWDSAIVLAVVAAYGAHLEWLFGNPLLGHPFSMRPEALQGLPYLYACALLFNYALVAILSARLLSATKAKLDFQTELLRNTYLAATFFMVPYGLLLAVPTQFVSLSWVGVSVFYFALSVLLKNRKYRWMGILNFLPVLGRVFAVDLAYLDIVYRIVSFLALGLVLLLVSLSYARRSHRRAAHAPPHALPAPGAPAREPTAAASLGGGDQEP